MKAACRNRMCVGSGGQISHGVSPISVVINSVNLISDILTESQSPSSSVEDFIISSSYSSED